MDIKYYNKSVNINVPSEDYITQCIVSYNTFYEVVMLDHIVRNYPNQKTIIDVGANFGNHACFFENFVNYEHMHCFEPHPDNFKILQSNIHSSKTTAHQLALSNKQGRTSLKPHSPNNCGAFTMVSGDDYPVATLDEFNFTNVTLMKIDVEGHELEVLQGAKKLIDQYHPILYIEISNNEQEIRDFLQGYKQTQLFPMDVIPTFEFSWQ